MKSEAAKKDPERVQQTSFPKNIKDVTSYEATQWLLAHNFIAVMQPIIHDAEHLEHPESISE